MSSKIRTFAQQVATKKLFAYSTKTGVGLAIIAPVFPPEDEDSTDIDKQKQYTVCEKVCIHKLLAPGFAILNYYEWQKCLKQCEQRSERLKKLSKALEENPECPRIRSHPDYPNFK